MKLTETTLLRGLTVLFALAALSIALLLNKERSITETTLKTKIDLLQSKVDSLEAVSDELNAELFATVNELGRYQLSLNYLNYQNPKAAQQFEDYLYTKTE